MTNTTNTTTNTTNNATNNATLATRAAGLLSKATAYGAAEKALQQAITAKRVYPAMAQDYSEQLGHELPLKTRDFVAVVGHLLVASEKPLKGVISKRKSEILAVLAELVGALTDTAPVSLPSWAIPKERAKKAEAAEESTEAAKGALDKANLLAEAEANAALAEVNAEASLAKAVALIVARSAELSAVQRDMLMAVVLAAEAEAEAEAEAREV